MVISLRQAVKHDRSELEAATATWALSQDSSRAAYAKLLEENKTLRQQLRDDVAAAHAANEQVIGGLNAQLSDNIARHKKALEDANNASAQHIAELEAEVADAHPLRP